MYKKKSLVLASVVSLLFLTWITAPFEALETAAVPGEEDVVIRQGDPASHQVALTCNVDWGEDVLPEILAVCEEKDVKMTFFVTGKWASKNPGLLREMYIAGHDIQNHGYSHALCSQVSEEVVLEEIGKTEEILQDLLGIRTRIFAPPSGDYDGKTVDLCRERGYLLSLWSADTIDWKEGSTAQVITDRILSKDLSGGIVLMHPKEATAEALPGLIVTMRERGLTIVLLRDLPIEAPSDL
ncbi:MAG: polysaccharide deacetylase family protein [Firmicutes bacterium]|nr:polysaccharide deacetylase family protein [Bacillota bacterium]